MTPQYKYYREARDTIKKINEHKERYVIIWYARGVIDGVQRIISIGVLPLSGQPRVFSIHTEICPMKQRFTGTVADYDECEKKMLESFYAIVQGQYREKIWLHWRMALFNYGFYSGLEDRCKLLGGNTAVISENNMIDVCDLFKKRYGVNFVNKNTKESKNSWRIKYLSEKNSIETAGFLEYDEEQGMLDKGQYDSILTSLSRKTNILKQFLDLSYKGVLKTDSSWKEIYGFSLQGIYEACKEKWWFNLLSFVLGIILGFLSK